MPTGGRARAGAGATAATAVGSGEHGLMESIVFSMVIALLVGIVVYQQIFFTKQIQTLVDKLMSRSFNEYQSALKPPAPRVQMSPEIPEDLRTLQEFSLM